MSVVQLLEKENKNLKEKKKGIQITGKTSFLRNLIISSNFKTSFDKFAQKNVVPSFRAF